MIEWRSATSRDKRILQGYEVADPAGRYYDTLLRQKRHREPWAEAVQKGLRNWRYRQVGRELWLGFEGDQLVSAGAYSGAFDEEGSSASFLVEYVSCAYSWRRCGVGDQCLGQLLAVISEASHAISGDVEVQAFVHEQNHASQKLFKRFGFAHVGRSREPIREGSGKKRLGDSYGTWLGQL